MAKSIYFYDDTCGGYSVVLATSAIKAHMQIIRAEWTFDALEWVEDDRKAEKAKKAIAKKCREVERLLNQKKAAGGANWNDWTKYDLEYLQELGIDNDSTMNPSLVFFDAENWVKLSKVSDIYTLKECYNRDFRGDLNEDITDAIKQAIALAKQENWDFSK